MLEDAQATATLQKDVDDGDVAPLRARVHPSAGLDLGLGSRDDGGLGEFLQRRLQLLDEAGVVLD